MKLKAKRNVGRKKVYDLTVDDTHSFFAWSNRGSQKNGVLAHNCHELSRQAMDALLLPMEDNVRGTQDKQLVCLFCTTEPEKMRPAIKSRCAPVFMVHPVEPDIIAKRLELICKEEKFEYDAEVLPLIAEVCECHIRDCLKAIEGISMQGVVSKENTFSYLHLDANELVMELLLGLGEDLSKLYEVVDRITAIVSPVTVYRKLTNICMLAFRSTLGSVKIPSYWDSGKLKELGQKHGKELLVVARHLSQSPVYATKSMLLCDLGLLDLVLKGELNLGGGQLALKKAAPIAQVDKKPGIVKRQSQVTAMGVYVNTIAQNRSEPLAPNESPNQLSATQFADILKRRVDELTEEKRGGSTGRENMGDS